MDAMKKQNRHGDTSSDTAASLKKDDFTTPPVNPIFQKENGLVVYASAAIIKRKEPINRVPLG